jgi:Limiting CO2-inducible proteins B/C beta carbonyic anhydrases
MSVGAVASINPKKPHFPQQHCLHPHIFVILLAIDTTTQTMKFTAALLALSVASSTTAFTTPMHGQRSTGRVSTTPSTSALNIVAGDKQSILEKFKNMFKADPPATDNKFDKVVKEAFPGAISNSELETRVGKVLSDKGLTPDNTLLATSLCADELARRLEDEFVKVFGNNFNLGGLSGFPFAGNTGFGAMAAHIPDDGYCLLIYGPHVGISREGTIGKVEREGIKLVDNCCGSAIAASNYLKGITDGGAVITSKIQQFSDFQQGAVQELILPHGKRLSDAKNRMQELPYALYDSQDVLMLDIVKTGAAGTKRGVALLGGIQINTGPTTADYFHPLRFDFINSKGDTVETMLKKIA